MFDVYVEGATDPSPDATRRLAEVMSQRYGLPAADLTSRLAKGRFRVKANVDSATAHTYVKDLEAIGARVTLLEARPGGASLPPPRRAGNSVPPPVPGPARTTSPPPLHPVLQTPDQRAQKTSQSPPMRPDHAVERPFGPAAAARPSSSSLPPSNLPQRPTPAPSSPPASILPPRTTPAPSNPPASILPPRTVTPTPTPTSNSPYQSGLAAAFHENTPVPELGALDKDAFSVASLDGREDVVEPAPAIGMSASIGPAAAPAPVAPTKDRPKDVPVDLFAPPDAADEQKFELAADEIEHREARKKAATPPAPMPVVTDKPSSPVLRPKAASPQPTNVPTGGVVASSPWDMPRWRLAGGVLAAVLVGFIPAHCVASIREDAYDKIDADVAAKEAVANRSDAPVPASQIDAYRETRLADKQSKRRSIALVSMLIWAVGGAGIGYLWFRRVPWDRIKFGQNWP